MLCTFVLFFSKAFTTKTIQIKGLVQFGLYNPEKLHVIRFIKSGTPSPKVWPVSGVLMRFWTVLNEKHDFLDFQMT